MSEEEKVKEFQELLKDISEMETDKLINLINDFLGEIPFPYSSVLSNIDTVEVLNTITKQIKERI